MLLHRMGGREGGKRTKRPHKTETNFPICSCRYEIRRSLPSARLLRAHRGCEARLWPRFVHFRLLKLLVMDFYFKREPVFNFKTYGEHLAFIYNCIQKWNHTSVIIFLFLINRWGKGWHQCQCLCRHQHHRWCFEALLTRPSHPSHYIWPVLQIYSSCK